MLGDVLLISSCFCSIYLGEPTNEAACRAAERLVEKGYPPEKILLVQGELAFASGSRVRNVRRVRITEYEQDDGIQILIGTVPVLARIRLRKDRCMNVMLKPPLAIVVSICIALPGQQILHCTFAFSWTRSVPTR